MDRLVSSFFDNGLQNNKAEQQGNAENNSFQNSIVVLNKILQSALAKAHSSIEAQRIIIRCDELPLVEGDMDSFERLFRLIIHFITGNKPLKGKQFLYVQCREEPAHNEASHENKKHYQIAFHSNIYLDAIWLAAHKNDIEECTQIIEKHYGRFTINNLNSGCSFTLHLTGKSL